MNRKKIAIIGGGGAGASAAWALDKVHDITLFEKEATLGGHAHTEIVEVEDQRIAVDLGVEFFSEKQAPNLSALLKHFGIETFISPLSFTAVYDGKDEYWSNHASDGMLWKRIRAECDRFHLDMHEVIHQHSDSVKRSTLGDFVRKQGYSDDFIYKALLPLMTTFSSCEAPLLDYSLTFCAISFNMGLLSFFQPSYWRKVKGGIGSYLSRIQHELKDKIQLNSKVNKIVRSEKGVVLIFDDNQQKEFDEVILAVHADQALSLMDSPSHQERSLLSQFEYINVQSILHHDAGILPSGIPHLSYCEFRGCSRESLESVETVKKLHGSLTRIINNLDCYKHIKTPILVTFDPKMPIDESKVIVKKNWKLPKLRPSDMMNKRRILEIQGHDHLWLCGTDTSYTGHEGAILSGLVIAEALGASYPFKSNAWAKIQFDVVKGIMGIYNPYEKFNNIIAASIYATAKKLGLHKSQVSRVLLDMYA